MTTIKDIARLSGYSIGTVSRVINQHADVSPAARKKIEKIIEQENFQPNSNAKLIKAAGEDLCHYSGKGTDEYLPGSYFGRYAEDSE
jgi:DNA-binding LacI/PurR family transcriptional regulator